MGRVKSLVIHKESREDTTGSYNQQIFCNLGDEHQCCWRPMVVHTKRSLFHQVQVFVMEYVHPQVLAWHSIALVEVIWCMDSCSHWLLLSSDY